MNGNLQLLIFTTLGFVSNNEILYSLVNGLNYIEVCLLSFFAYNFVTSMLSKNISNLNPLQIKVILACYAILFFAYDVYCSYKRSIYSKQVKPNIHTLYKVKILERMAILELMIKSFEFSALILAVLGIINPNKAIFNYFNVALVIHYIFTIIRSYLYYWAKGVTNGFVHFYSIIFLCLGVITIKLSKLRASEIIFVLTLAHSDINHLLLKKDWFLNEVIDYKGCICTFGNFLLLHLAVGRSIEILKLMSIENHKPYELLIGYLLFVGSRSMYNARSF